MSCPGGRLALRLLSCCLCSVSAAGAAASAKLVDPWTAEGGAAEAGRLLAVCLDNVEFTPNARRADCIRTAYSQCEKTHGTMSQSDLNDCAFYSRTAWEKRLSAVRTKLASAKPARKGGGPTPQMVAAFNASEARWEAWYAQDCEMQSAIHEGGSIRPLIQGLCLSDHVATRTVELEALLQKWSR